MYVDESGIDSFISRTHAWAPRGKKIYGEISGHRFARESFVAAWCDQNILAPFCYQGTCHTQLFNFWVRNHLVPALKPGQIVILDNATFHKSKETETLIQQTGAKVLFLPPYSPDLNPIERFWANLKRRIRQTIHLFKTLSAAIDHAFNDYEFKRF